MRLKQILSFKNKKFFYKNNRNKKSFNESLMSNWIDAIVYNFYTDEKKDQFKNLENGEEKNR